MQFQLVCDKLFSSIWIEPPFALVCGWRYPLLIIAKGGSFSTVSTLRLYSPTSIACGSLYETKNPNPSPIEKRFGFSILAVVLPVDIPMGWEPQRNLAVRALRVAFADFSAAPWQGFEKSERGPNNSSLFQPQATVVVVAVQVLLSAVAAKGKALCKTKKTATKSCLPCGADKRT